MAESNLKISLISEDIIFRGEINSQDQLLIEGNVEGSIKTKSTVLVESTAFVKASLSAPEVSVKGTLQGNINNANFIHIYAQGTVTGDIECENLQVDKKGVLNGSCIMRTHDA
ncbi:MAG: polymer-forming cytoskeletal protein [Spirochaetia bacterium]|nr:polymer-forming cytoskeletal protein [Spirochaetia bacterium]